MSIFRSLVLLAGLAAGSALAVPPPRPKLVIAISIDQFSADLFAEHRAGFTGGLKRLQQGVVFPSGYQSHAATETCPGHSTILSGMHPSGTGMVGNTVWDPVTATMVYCLHDPDVAVAYSTDTRGPSRLKAPTLGAWMKDANPASRVFAVAGKDRAALPMGGARADGAFWWNEKAGGFTTWLPAGSTADDRLKVVAAFNARLATAWTKAPPRWVAHDKSCAALSGRRSYGGYAIDHVPASNAGWTPAANGKFGDDPAFENWIRASPEFDRITLELASDIIRTQKLGQGAAPDLIAIGLSATDYVGHRFGSQGPEMCDQLAWVDARLGAFFAVVDALKIPYVVVLTADHGSIDAAERAAEHGAPAAVRIDTAKIIQQVVAGVQSDLKLDYVPLAGDSSQLTIVDFGEPDTALRGRVQAATLARLKALPDVAAVFTRAELLAGKPPRGKSPETWTLAERFAASADADRSGDIAIAWRQFSTPFGIDPARNPVYIAGHGSPWDYDRRVPMLFWWPGATGFEQPLPVETVDIAPTLAGVLGIKAPPVDGRCLDLDAGPGDSCAINR